MIEVAPQVNTWIARFAEKAAPLGTRVEHVPDIARFASVVADSARERSTEIVFASPQIAEAVPGLETCLASNGILLNVIRDRDGARDQQIGLSLAANCVVETGSVLLNERQIQNRAPSLMTLHNIVLAPVAALIESLNDAAGILRAIASQPGGGYASFMTGPSRTADIEMSLTVGVQGPGQISVIFVDNLGPE